MHESGNNNGHDNTSGEEARVNDSPEFLAAMAADTRVLPTPAVGQKLHATIRSIGEEWSFADYGGRSEATIETQHLKDADGSLRVSIGDRIEAYVVSSDDGIVLAPSFTPAPNEALTVLRQAQSEGTPVQGKVVGLNAGGLEVEIAGVRAFCPVSQVDIAYCPDPSVFVHKTLEFRVLELADGGRRVVVSRKAVQMQQKAEIAARMRSELKAGEERDGTVVRMESFGAFVDLGGLDGMVHVSEISHDRVNHPKDALKIGDRVRVRVLEVGTDPKGRDRISLSIKAAQQDPWNHIEEVVQAGQKRSGKVVRIADFGAFVRILPGIEGLVHVSEITSEPITHPREALKEGQEVEVRVLRVDVPRRRIGLSMRDAADPHEAVVMKVGSVVEGLVRTHKPYGIFVDLPGFGPRVSGLLPVEETGVPKGGDLAKRYPSGEKLEVVIQQIDEKGRIRLAIPSANPSHAATSPSQQQASRGSGSAMAEALRRALQGGANGRA
ncbi:MAG: S1 RNA-binding domain-containing protein [Candidatus Eisenbacteria bacterium]|nr:S1 RNA-binding domain-containing protein [Candidatus Eisenbacteria bacterium]